MRRLYALYRFTERIKQWFTSRFTGLGKVFLFTVGVALFFGLSVQRTMIYQIFTFCLSFLSFSFVLSLWFQSELKIKRILPSTCVSGKALRYTLLIENNGTRTEKGLYIREAIKTYLPDWVEFISTKEEGEDKRNFFDRKMLYYRWLWLLDLGKMAKVEDQLLPDVPPGKSTKFDISILPLRRGNVHLTGHILTKLDPFGLCKRQKILDNGDNLLVLPKLYPAPKLFFDGSRKYHQGGITAAQNRGDSNEFLSLREYATGDPVKHIDWKSTARTGRTMVKQYRDEYFSRYGLVLDSFTPKKYSIEFEEAVSVAASLLLAQDSVNSVLDLLFVGDECITCTMGSGLAGHQRMLEILASVETSRDKTFAELAGLVRSHSALLSGLVLVFIDFDIERRKLVDYLASNKVPTKILLLTENKEKTESLIHTHKSDTSITIIEVDHVEEQVQQL